MTREQNRIVRNLKYLEAIERKRNMPRPIVDPMGIPMGRPASRRCLGAILNLPRRPGYDISKVAALCNVPAGGDSHV